MQRRDFLKFMGRGTITTSLLAGTPLLQGCSSVLRSLGAKRPPSLLPTFEDQVVLAPGLKSEVLIKWQDPINSKGDLFGFNNDFIGLLPGKNADEAWMWVNHEYINPLFVSGFNPAQNIGVRKTRAQVDIEQKNVGGSMFRIERKENRWTIDKTSDRNFRVDATTPMRLVAERPLAGSKTAIGTTGNCYGGKTPWGTFLSCEENFDDFFGNVKFSKKAGGWKRHQIASSSSMAWDDHTPHAPEHYGWVVEINPVTKECKKLTALGRFAHEGALVVPAADGRCVVYMGDDAQDEHFYKFIARKPGSLEQGDLYVANLERGSWELLSIENPKLKNHFLDQTDLLIRTREAAALVGATPLDRPEACAQDPIGKGIYLNCTMNKGAGRIFGSILKFEEAELNPLSLKFNSSVFLNGGPETGFSCPDNLCFDAHGNMWMTSDIPDYDIGTDKYKKFGNNSLFFIPLAGEYAGEVFRFASAPKAAEFTGPCFSPDGKTLFLSVQHPGATTQDLSNPTSTWPDGAGSTPRPSVIAITGPLLDSIMTKNSI